MRQSSPGAVLAAIAVGTISIILSLGIGRPDIGLGLSVISLCLMALSSIDLPQGPKDKARTSDWYLTPPARRDRCRCGRCEQCDPLAQSWGRGR